MAVKKNKEAEALKLVRDCWNSSLKDKQNSDFLDQCLENYGFIRTNTEEMFKGIEFPKGCPVLPVNRIFDTTRAMASKMAPQFPEGKFGPVQAEDDDYAQYADAWFQWWQDNNYWKAIAKSIIQNAIPYNVPAVEVIFDKYDNYPEGSLKTKVRLPWEYGRDPLGKKWIIIEDRVPKDLLMLTYPGSKNEIERTPDALPSSFLSSKGAYEDFYLSKDKGGLSKADHDSGYVTIYKLFMRDYTLEDISEDETKAAVDKEYGELTSYEFEGTEEMVTLGGYEPELPFDETEDHDLHVEYLIQKLREWEEGIKVNQGEAGQAIVDAVWEKARPHIEKHRTTQAYMDRAKLQYGKRFKYPGGRMIISLGDDHILYDDKNPVGVFPLVQFPMLQYDNDVWGKPFVSHIVPIQQKRDTLLTQWAFLVKVCVPKWKRMSGSTTKTKGVNNDPTQTMDCEDPGNEGWDFPHLTLPQLKELIDRLDEDLEKISNIFDAYRGMVPTGVKSGKGIEALSSMAETVTNLDTMSFEEAAKELFMVLWTFAIHYLPETHFERVVGSRLEPEKFAKIDFKRLKTVNLDIRADFKDPSKTTKDINLEKVIAMSQTPVAEVLGPVALGHMALDNLDFPNIDDYRKLVEDYLQGAQARAQELIAQAMAQQGMMELGLGGGGEGEAVPAAPEVEGGLYG